MWRSSQRRSHAGGGSSRLALTQARIRPAPGPAVVSSIPGVRGPTSPEWDLVREWVGTLSDLGGVGGLLGWDRETLMPPAGAEGRARQMGTLAALRHRELVRPDAGEALAALAGSPELDPQGAGRGAARHPRPRAGAAGARGAGARAERGVLALRQRLGRGPRRPTTSRPTPGPLATVVALKRREAEAVGVGEEPYDALLDEFEPGARAADLEPVFADLRARLTPLVAGPRSARWWNCRRTSGARPARWRIAHEIARLVGFDESAGVIALSAHPFTGSPHRGDVRFTTRLTPESPIGNISAVLHELGHALYEQGFPAEADRTPVYDAPSLGAHESQSRFWENQIGHTRAFWDQIEPAMRRHFPEAMTGIDAALLHRAAHVVRPSLIRVEADEVTYNLHIVLRFQIELALIRGDLEVADLPGAFSDGMEDLLGIRPPTDALGAMQDIHWADGLFGYFPTYTLGNLYAAQLAEAADGRAGRPRAGGGRAAASPTSSGFMRERVHRHGALLPTGELMRQATGVRALLGRPDLAPGALLPGLSPGRRARRSRCGPPRPIAVGMSPLPPRRARWLVATALAAALACAGPALAAPTVDELRAERAALADRDAALASRAADSQAALATGRARLDIARVRYLRALDGLNRRLRGIYVTGEPSPIIEFITGGDLDESQAAPRPARGARTPGPRPGGGLPRRLRGAARRRGGRPAPQGPGGRRARAPRRGAQPGGRAPGDRREGAARGRGGRGPGGRPRHPGAGPVRLGPGGGHGGRVRRRRRAERGRRGRSRPRAGPGRRARPARRRAGGRPERHPGRLRAGAGRPRRHARAAGRRRGGPGGRRRPHPLDPADLHRGRVLVRPGLHQRAPGRRRALRPRRVQRGLTHAAARARCCGWPTADAW